MHKIIKFLGCLITLVSLLFGVPIALIYFGRFSDITRVNFVRLLTTYDNGHLLLAIITLICWGAWLFISTTIVLEFVSFITSGRISLVLPGCTWFRPKIIAILMAVVAPLSVNSVSSAVSNEASSKNNQSLSQEYKQHLSSVQQSEKKVMHSQRIYVVKPGDSLWSIAENLLGEGSDWRKIASLNPKLNPNNNLIVGQEIVVPVVDKKPEVATGSNNDKYNKKNTANKPELPKQVVVQKNDSLWKIAKKYLGNPYLWTEIYQINKNKISDPDEIEIGMVLKLPSYSKINEVKSVSQNPTPLSNKAAGSLVTSLQSQDSKNKSNNKNLIKKHPTPASTAKDKIKTDSTISSDLPGKKYQDAGENKEIFPKSSKILSEKAKNTKHIRDLRKPALPDFGVKESIGSSGDEDIDHFREYSLIIGSVGSGLALVILGALKWRRLRQSDLRGLGKRFVSSSALAKRVEAAFRKRASQDIENIPSVDSLGVMIGWSFEGKPIYLDLEVVKITQIINTPDNAEHVKAMLASIITFLSCVDSSQDNEIVVVGADHSWPNAIDNPAVISVLNCDDGVKSLVETAAARKVNLGSQTLAQVRKDHDRESAYQTKIFIFCETVSAKQIAQISNVFELGDTGIRAVILVDKQVNLTQNISETIKLEDKKAWTKSTNNYFLPQLIERPARRALIELFENANSNEMMSAPWWSDDSDLPENVKPLRQGSCRSSEELTLDTWNIESPPHPTLLLLGSVELRGANGKEPTRSKHQCEEYCAWLLENPDRKPSQMLDELLIAETTRRSNMSRLRAWLGNDPDGEPYLPDGYNGRMILHSAVTSDWDRFNMLLSGGVNRASETCLKKALELVRGTPLGGVAEWQWVWASQLRSDMTAMIRDAAIVLAEISLENKDTQLARWAIGQGLLVAPKDEQLRVTMLRIENTEGNFDLVQQMILDLTRHSRTYAQDLSDKSVSVIQQILIENVNSSESRVAK